MGLFEQNLKKLQRYFFERNKIESITNDPCRQLTVVKNLQKKTEILNVTYLFKKIGLRPGLNWSMVIATWLKLNLSII